MTVITKSEVVIYCASCNLPLTGPLCRLPADSMLSNDDRTDYIPRGYFTISDGSFFTRSEGQIIANLKDLVNTKHHADLRRLNGCCGLDGCDGRNTVCINGHEIGTERSDCWMPHAICFDPQAVRRPAATTIPTEAQ